MAQQKQNKSEFGLIDWIRQSRSGLDDLGEGVIVDIGDDMAMLRIGGEELLITADMLLEGVHFDLSAATLEQAGYKAMACSLSDCAAMAAVPIAAVVAVAVPGRMSMDQAKQLYAGVQKAATMYNCPVVGGDIARDDVEHPGSLLEIG